MLAARAAGRRVEVSDADTEFTTTYANPDGTLTTEIHSGQQRFRDAQGRWERVDLALTRNADGSVSPRGQAYGLRLPGPSSAPGGDGATVVASEHAGAGRGVALAWPGRLPTPELSGSVATYREVSPGVDLQVEALRDGYEQKFVLNSRPAGPVSWRLPLLTKGLTPRVERDGSVSFVDEHGVVRSRFAVPLAYDASVDPRSGDPSNTAPVAVSLARRGSRRAVLTLTPDAAWLAAPSTRFPVTVDPTYATLGNIYPSFDAFVESDYSSDQSGSTELRLGTYDDGTVKARSFLAFPMSTLTGKTVISGKLSLYETWSYSCSAREWDVRATGSVSTATRWTSQPSWGSTIWASPTATKGYSSSCPDGRDTADITGLVQNWANNGNATNTLGIRAADETDSYGWKKFASSETSNDPYLTVTYDRAPGAASAPTLSPVASYNSTYYTSDTTPTFTTKASDADANTVQYTFEVHQSTSSSTVLASCTTGYVSSGSSASCAPGAALPDNSTYVVRARAYDGHLWGPWSSWTTFKMAHAAPGVPSISCPAPYANGSWADTVPSSNLTCTISAPGSGTTEPVRVLASIDGGTEKTYAIASPGPTGQVTVSVSNSQGGHSIKARTQSAANIDSGYATYTFGYGAAALSSPRNGATSADWFQVTATAPPKGSATTVTAVLKYRQAGTGGDESTGWTTDTSVTVPVIDNSANGLTTSLRWNAATAAAAVTGSDRLPALLDLQLCYTYAYRSGSTTTQCTWSQSPVSVQHVPHAFSDGYPTAAAGPGQVALWTGEVNLSATDVSVPGYLGELSISRSYFSLGGPNDTVTGVFGPGWTAQLSGPDAGDADLQVVDDTATDGTLVFIADDGSTLVYQEPGRGHVQDEAGTYAPVGDDATLSGSAVTVTDTAGPDGLTNTADDVRAMTMTDDDGTVTTWLPVSYTSGVTTTWKPDSVAEPATDGTTTYGWDGAGRVTRILAATPPGVSCSTTGATLTVGCRALDITYATTTTATASAPGDYAGQVQQITLRIFNPDKAGGAGMDTIPVVSYRYDTSGRLVSVTDPRSGLTTHYGYSTSGLLTSVTPPGLATYHLTYTTGGTPQLQNVTRDTAVTGAATSTLASYVYGIDPTVLAANLPDMRQVVDPTTGDIDPTIGVGVWGQADAPTFGAAVFGPDHPVTTTSPSGITAGDWPFADVYYTDGLGYTVDTASYGAGDWQIGSTDYDAHGDVIRTLTPGGIAAIRSAAASIAPGGSVDPDQYATVTRYNTGATLAPAGTLVTDVWGPARQAVLADGSQAWVRPHSHTDYDQGAPSGDVNPATGDPYRLPTTVTTSVTDGAAVVTDPTSTPADLETTSVTRTGYDPIDGADPAGPTSGWTLGQPTTTTVVMPDTTDDITRATRYDTDGRAVETRQPLSTGADAGTTLTTYYIAGTGSGDPRCDSHPQWAGLPCLTQPAAAPDSGPTLPATYTDGYSYLLAATDVQETSGPVTRTTHIAYLTDGRTDTVTTTVTGLASSTPVPESKALYDTATGLPTTAETLDATGTVTGTVSTGYDGWGRPVAYTNTQGETTTTSYDGAGRVATVTDTAGHVTRYGYDTDANGHDEHRDLPTSLTVDGAGSYTAAYDPDGNLVTQTMPGGLIQTRGYDTAGELTSLAYTGQVSDPDTGTVGTGEWLGWSRDYDTAGRVAREWTPDGAAFSDPTVGTAVSYDRAYSYDRAGRLVTLQDRTAAASGTPAPGDPATDTTPCVTRTYTFDKDGNRTGLTTTPPDPTTGDCSTATTPTTRSWSYDTADRNTVASGYTYDELGRTTTIPASDTQNGAGELTIGYYDTDAARAITNNGTTETYTLDPAGRLLQSDTGPTGATPTRTVVRHYTDDSDNPSSVDVTAGGTTTTTRYTDSIGGDLGATINPDGSIALDLADPHGDIVSTASLAATGATATGIDAWTDYDEYGNPHAATPTDPLGYSWLGTKQRSTDTNDTGLTLMGARLYNPTTGRFTSLDPVPGGNDNAYNYPDDPVNGSDTTGQCEDDAYYMGCGSGASALDPAIYVDGIVFANDYDAARYWQMGMRNMAEREDMLAHLRQLARRIRRIEGYTRHGLDRAILREGGVSPAAMRDAVKYGRVQIRINDGRVAFRFTGRSATVNLNEYGRLVSAWPRGSAGRRYL